MSFGILGIFGAGLLTFLTPCVLPLIPMYLAALVGGDLERVSGAHRGQLIIRGGFFSLGFLAVFTAMGMGASAVGRLLLEHRLVLSTLGGLLILLFGLRFVGLIQIPLLDRVIKANDAGLVRRSTNGGALVLGIVFAAGWSPCAGPVLGSILTYTASTTQDPLTGAVYLALYGAGLAVPLLVTAAFAQAGLAALRRIRRFVPVIEKALGVALLVVAASLLFDIDWSAEESPTAVQTMQSGSRLNDSERAPRMLELYSESCPICQQMAPLVSAVQAECEGRGVHIETLDVGRLENRNLIDEYRLVGVPTFVFEDAQGEEVARLVGQQTKTALLQALSALSGERCPSVGPLPQEEEAAFSEREISADKDAVNGDGASFTADESKDEMMKEATCRSTTSFAEAARNGSKKSRNTSDATSRPSAQSAANRPTACSPDLL